MTPRQRSEKDNPGTLPIAAYAKEPPPSITMPVPEEVLLPNFEGVDNTTWNDILEQRSEALQYQSR